MNLLVNIDKILLTEIDRISTLIFFKYISSFLNFVILAKAIIFLLFRVIFFTRSMRPFV